MNRLMHILLSAMLVSIGCSTRAAESPVAWLTEGKGIPVCEAYLADVQKMDFPTPSGCLADREFEDKRLIRLGHLGDTWPMEDDVSPNDPPEWLRSDKLYFEQIYPFLTQYDMKPARYFPRKELRSWRATPEQVTVANQERFNRTYIGPQNNPSSSLYFTTVDIDNDKKADRIFYFPRCSEQMPQVDSPTPRTMIAPIILKPNKDEVDVAKTLRILRHPIPQQSQRVWREVILLSTKSQLDMPVAEMASDSVFGIFSYAGKTYVDFTWAGTGIRGGIQSLPPRREDEYVVRIFKTQRGKTSRQCTVKFAGLSHRTTGP